MSGRKVLYFGYGANRALEMMQAITGKTELVGYSGRLPGYELCIQRLDQVPDFILPTSPVPISPRALLKESWDEKFTSYTIRPNEGSEVYGIIWELDSQDKELVKDWELIAFGWYKEIKAKAITEDGREVDVETEGLREGQEIDRVVDGRNYQTWLNNPEDLFRATEKARREYFERLRKKQ